MPPPHDDPLIAAYLARRQELLRHFRVRLRSEEAAQELVQDMYLKIVAHPPGDAVLAPGPYLYRLGANLMLDQIRGRGRSSRRAEAYAEAHGTGGIDETPAADDALAARQQVARIIAAVQELPPAVQQAFRLHKLDGLSHAETALAMGVSRSSVEKYLMTSLRHIAARLGDDG